MLHAQQNSRSPPPSQSSSVQTVLWSFTSPWLPHDGHNRPSPGARVHRQDCRNSVKTRAGGARLRRAGMPCGHLRGGGGVGQCTSQHLHLDPGGHQYVVGKLRVICSHLLPKDLWWIRCFLPSIQSTLSGHELFDWKILLKKMICKKKSFEVELSF